jgi:non-heme chloroperoxidase
VPFDGTVGDGTRPIATPAAGQPELEARPLSLAGRDGHRIAADVHGDPTQPLVLLLHGGGQTRFAWGGTARTLAASGWCAISMDLRGHGESAWAPDKDYSFDAFVEDLRCVVESLGTPPVLVGASLGGITSLIAEGEAHPSIAAALVLVDIAPKIERSRAQPAQHARRR